MFLYTVHDIVDVQVNNIHEHFVMAPEDLILSYVYMYRYMQMFVYMYMCILPLHLITTVSEPSVDAGRGCATDQIMISAARRWLSQIFATIGRYKCFIS